MNSNYSLKKNFSSSGQELGTLLGTRFAVLGISLLTQVVLAHALLAEGRGIYAVCVLFGMLSGVIFIPGVVRGAQYFVMSQRMSVSEGLSSGYALCALGTVVAAVVMLPLVNSELRFFDTAQNSSYYISFLLVPAIMISGATLRQLAGLRQFTRLAIISLVQSATVLLSIVFLVWIMRLGVNGAIVSLLISHLLSTAGGVIVLRRHCGLSFQCPKWAGLKIIFRYGLRDYGASVGLAGGSMVITLALGFMAEPADIGLVAFAIAIVMKANIIPNAVSTYLEPRVAANPRRGSDISARCIGIALWVVVFVLLGWIAISKVAVGLLLPDEFSPVTRLTWIMSLGVCAAAAAKVLITHFRASNRPEVTSWSVCAGLLTSLGLLAALYPMVGISGAAWAFAGGHICRVSLLTWMFTRDTELPIGSVLLPWRSDLTYLFGSVNRFLLRRW